MQTDRGTHSGLIPPRGDSNGIADGSFVPNERRVVADATVASAADRTVTEQLRELSSFDDLSDEVAT